MLSNVITKSRGVILLEDTNVDYLKKNENLVIKTFSISIVFNKLLPNQQELQKAQKH